jgi:hypothetical protein
MGTSAKATVQILPTHFSWCWRNPTHWVMQNILLVTLPLGKPTMAGDVVQSILFNKAPKS